jgi:hypothetical protein
MWVFELGGFYQPVTSGTDVNMIAHRAEEA